MSQPVAASNQVFYQRVDISGKVEENDSMRSIERRGKRLSNLVGALIAIVALLVVFVREMQEFPRSLNWPTVQGTVITSNVLTDGEGGLSLVFEYSYVVDGVSYTNDRATFFQYVTMSGDRQINQFVSENPVRSQVNVLYDPGDPTKAVIMRTIPLEQIWSPILLGVCLGSVLIFAVLGFFFRLLTRGLFRRVTRSFG